MAAPPVSTPRIGVLAMQGDVREHLRMLTAAGADPTAVRRPDELAGVDALVLPGGESTTMHKLTVAFGLFDALRERIAAGMPALGTCAGMIMLAERIEGGIAGQETVGGIDMTVRRNAFGRQVDSFEADIAFAGLEPAEPLHAVFIRAPWVEKVGKEVTVLCRVGQAGADARIVAVRQQDLVATSFHPELGGDDRVHRYFVDVVRQAS